jgi:hypothetical protein
MYCSTCECDFDGWAGKCPNCKNPLQDGKPPSPRSSDELIAYEALVAIVRDHGGTFDIELSAIEVGKSKSTRFPYLGYGYAWTKRMVGSREGIEVDLNTTEVGKDRRWEFPYRGLGYAWRQELQGRISGNEASLSARKVTRKKRWSFPYSGYGYAWTEEMAGECGERLSIELKTTDVSKIRRWMFPYFGFGYAWVNEGILSLSLNNNQN